MQRFIQSKSFKILTGLFAVLLAGIIFAAVSNSGSSPITNVVSVVFGPLHRASSYISSSFDDFKGGFVSSEWYRNKIEKLELQIQEYREQLVDYEKQKQKIMSYEAFLEVRDENPDFEFVPAAIISRDVADAFNSFVLNKGSLNGVNIGDSVIYGKYLVGVVREIKSTTCVVRTILDPTVNVSVYEVRTREDGFVSGTTDLMTKGQVKLSGIARSTSISSGGIVCTSGVGGVFPRDLIVGTVLEVKNDDVSISSYALLETGIDVLDLIDVFIITAFQGQGE